jgi:rfaE bifunctional protein nucleotidyltransferase chain/domain
VTRLVVLGDVLLDRDVEGSATRLAPDAPVPVVDVRSVLDRAGGAGLAAVLAARPDVEVDLVAAFADDAAGHRVRDLLRPVLRAHPLVPLAATPVKTRVVVAGRPVLRLDDHGELTVGPRRHARHEGEAGGGGVGATDAGAVAALLEGADAVLVADYGGPVARDPVVREVLTRVAATTPVVWDPHPRGDEPVPGCAAVTPNRAEAVRLVGEETTSSALVRQLHRRWGGTPVVMTEGAAGALVAEGPDEPVRCAGRRCPDHVDTCGAGDRFAGALALGLAGGSSLQRAAQVACDDVSRWLSAGGVRARAGDADDPLEVVERVRASGGTVVATGGCFDVLHAGHLATLETARAVGDCLVVLVNSDDSVRRLKGAGRPVVAEEDRVRLLQGLRCVDAVVVFDDDTPTAALGRLRPDVWVKGGDYRARDLPETRVIEAAGGRVEVVALQPGRSTTSVLDRLGVGGADADG